jgi:hypothetical protein
MGGWTKLHKEELRDLYSPTSIIRIIKWRLMRWERHVARMGEKRKGRKARGKQITTEAKTSKTNKLCGL